MLVKLVFSFVIFSVSQAVVAGVSPEINKLKDVIYRYYHLILM